MRWIPILVVAIAAITAAEANFAAAPGFSGRVADCATCHLAPVTGETASIDVDGVPDAWEPGAAYDLTITVSGGTTPIPGGPQGGFEIEALTGTLAPAPDSTGVRSFHDKQATYTEDGVFQREWLVRWTAPELDAMPADVTLWIAGVAANGNHNVMLNTSDQGEREDATANTTLSVPPSQAAWETWRAIPLQPPRVERIQATTSGHTIEGTMPDANATAIQVFDGAKWQHRPVASSWRLSVVGDEVRLRAAGSERVSPEIIVDLENGVVHADPTESDQGAPVPAWTVLLPLTFLAIARRHP